MLKKILVICITLCLYSTSYQMEFRNTNSRVINAHKRSVTSVNFSPDGKYILSTSIDRKVKLWNTSTARLVKRFNYHYDWVNCSAFSPDGKLFATGGHDRYVYVVSMKKLVILNRIRVQSSRINNIAFSKNGKRIYTISHSGKSVYMCDVSSGKVLKKIELDLSLITSSAFSNDRTIIAVGSDNMVSLWDLNKGTKIHVFRSPRHSAGVISLAFSSDNKYLASGGGNNIRNFDSSINLWDLEKKIHLKTFKGHISDVYVRFSPNNKYLLSSSSDRSVKIWKIEDLVLHKTLKAKQLAFWCIDSTSDFKYVASGSVEGKIAIWNLKLN